MKEICFENLPKTDLIKKLLVQQSELRKERNCFLSVHVQPRFVCFCLASICFFHPSHFRKKFSLIRWVRRSLSLLSSLAKKYDTRTQKFWWQAWVPLQTVQNVWQILFHRKHFILLFFFFFSCVKNWDFHSCFFLLNSFFFSDYRYQVTLKWLSKIVLFFTPKG